MSRARRTDVVVVGAGPAGLAAAAAAAERGKQVLLIDQGIRSGGQIWRHRYEQALPAQARQLLARTKAAGVTFAHEARVIDAPAVSELIVDFRGRIDRQGADAIILATGAKERFLPFPGWTLPGVMGVGGLQALLKSGLGVQGTKVILAGSGPLLLPVAASLAGAGAELGMVAEQASLATLLRFGLAVPHKWGQALGYRTAFLNAPFRAGAWVVRADGDDRVREVTLTVGGRERRMPCDWLGAAAGLVPNTDLGQLMGCTLTGDAFAVDQRQRTSVEGVWAVGECTGVGGDDAAIAEGEIAGRAAAGDATGAESRALQQASARGRLFARRLAEAFAPRAELLALADPETILCRCEDVRVGQIDPAWTQRQAKLWTRVGMGACQGAVCGTACAALYGWEGNAVRAPIGNPECGGWGGALREG